MATDLIEGLQWKHHEIENLLKLWSAKDVQNELENMHQNMAIYERISSELAELDIHRSAVSCRDKIKKLKFKYRRIRDKNGDKKSRFKFYEIMRTVLGDSVEYSGERSHEASPNRQVFSHPSRQPDTGNESMPNCYNYDYDHIRYSPSNASSSIVYSDSDDSDYEQHVNMNRNHNSDHDFNPGEISSQCSVESQQLPNISQEGNCSMFPNPLANRTMQASKSDASPRFSPYQDSQNTNSNPMNAAQASMKRQRGCHHGHRRGREHGGYDQGVNFMGNMGDMGPPFLGRCGFWPRHHGMYGRGGGGKMARMDQYYDNLFNKIMQNQRETQERFLASQDKQQKQYYQFEIQRQELENRRREEERRHEKSVFQTMLNSLTIPCMTRRMSPNEYLGTSQPSHQSRSLFSLSHTKVNMTLKEVKKMWRLADAVCFDVDSTVCRDEGVDQLAAFCGVGKEVAEWTRRAMGGGVSFRVALKERLDIIKPSKQQLEDFLVQRPPQLSDGIRNLVNELRKRGKAVYLISGGFRSIIEPVAKLLSIPSDHVYANRLNFFFTGEYSGFDESQPTSDSGGKGKVIQTIKDQYHHEKLVMIGDGATDLEAAPPADAFIGYGGNVVRDSVKSGSTWYVTDFSELVKELQTDS